MSISSCIIPLLLFNFIEIEKTGLTLRKRRRWQRNSLPLEDWGRKGMETGRVAVICTCVTHRLWMQSHRSLGRPGESTGYAVDGLVQELFRGPDGGTEWSTDAGNIKRSPVSGKRPPDMSELWNTPQIHQLQQAQRHQPAQSDFSGHQPAFTQRESWETLSSLRYGDLSPFLWHHFKREQRCREESE